MTVKKHYDDHLADFYSWMLGDFDKAKDSFKDFCIENEIKPENNGKAIDLGAGNGIQSIALAEIGFNIKAVDFSEKLLSELNERVGNMPIELVLDDIKNVKAIANTSVELIICCGDTISHLDQFSQLDELLQDCFDSLLPNGHLILTFRDYSVALTDTDRFIPVKSDDNKILTCVIDYSDETICVTDLLYEKEGGAWKQKISSYNKLRIRTDYIIDKAKSIGFNMIKNENRNRMTHLIVKK